MGPVSDPDLTPVAQAPPTDPDLTPVPKAPPEPDMSDMKKYVKDNLVASLKNGYVDKDSPDFFKQALQQSIAPFQSGFQHSALGLKLREKVPDKDLPQDADWATRQAFNMGTMAGDLPLMASAGMAGALAGPITAGAAALAAPAIVKKYLMDRYQKGDIKDPADFMQRTMGIAYEGIKGAATGAATEFTGGLASKFVGPAAGFVAKATTMTTMGKALEGQMPRFQDFTDAAVLMGGFELALGAGRTSEPPATNGVTSEPPSTTETAPPHVTAKLMNIYARTGALPHEVLAEAEKNPVLKAEILSTSSALPEVPNPTEPTEVKTPDGGVEIKHLVNPAFDEELKQAQQRAADQKPGNTNPDIERTPEEQELMSKFAATQPEPAKMPIMDRLKNWYANRYDYSKNLTWAIEDVQKEWGDRHLTPEENSAIQTRLFAGHMDKVVQVFNEGTRDAVTDQKNGEGINQIYKEVPNNDQDGFDLYSAAKRGQELNARGIQPWSEYNEESTQKIIDAGKDKFDALDQRRTDFSNRVLKYGADKGLYTQDSYQRMVKANQTYLPFERLQEPDKFTGKSGGSGSAVPKRIFGDDSPILNPRMTLYRNVEAIIRQADINEIRQKAISNLSYEDENGDLKSDYLEKVPAKMAPITVKGEEISKALAKEGIDLSPDDVTIFRPESSYLKDNQIVIRTDGKAEVYEGDPGVIDTLKRLQGDKTTMDLATQFMSGFSKSLRVGTTSDPGFGAFHAFRAGVMSGIYTNTGQLPFIHSMLAAKEFMGGNSETFQNWMYDGGAVSSWEKLDNQYIKNNLEAQEPDSPLSFTAKAWNVVHNSLQISEAFIKNTDNISRFVEYKRTIEQGGSRGEAAFNAREVTPDYAKAGIQRSMLKSGVAFLNAHISSLDRMNQEFMEKPKRMAARLSVLTAFAAMDWFINKDDKDVQSLSDWRRYGFFNLNITRAFGIGQHDDGTGFILSLPEPWAPGIIFGGGMKAMLDGLLTDKPHVLQSFGEALMGSVVPPIVPTVLSPIADQFANKNHFTGAPLVPTKALRALPEVQYQPYTSETAKLIGRAIGFVGGDIGPKDDPLSSGAVVENYIRGWGGTLGGWVLKLADEGLAKAGITPKNVGKTTTDTIADWPILSRFLTRYPNLKTQDMTDFYNNVDKTTRVMNTLSIEEKKGDLGAALKLTQAHPDMQIKLSQYSQAIALDRKIIQSIQDNPTIEPTEKRQLVDKLMMDAFSRAVSGNQMMDKFHQAVQKTNGGN